MPLIKSLLEVARERLDEYAESVSAEFLPSVHPIYRSTDRWPRQQIASCTLFEIRREKYLLTAAQVIDENKSWSLFVGGQTETVEIEYEEFLTTNKPNNDRKKDPYDRYREAIT